jgi:hypothetical protein
LERVGPIDTRYQNAFDYDLFVRFAAVARPAFLDRVLAFFRVYGEGKTSVSFIRTFDEELDAASRHAGDTNPVQVKLHQVNRLKLVTTYRMLALLERLGRRATRRA